MARVLDAHDRWPLVALGVYAAAVGPTQLFWDDGFYYLQIARNAADGVGSSMDGLNPTSGYHPLWLLGLVPIFGWRRPRPTRSGPSPGSNVWVNEQLPASERIAVFALD